MKRTPAKPKKCRNCERLRIESESRRVSLSQYIDIEREMYRHARAEATRLSGELESIRRERDEAKRDSAMWQSSWTFDTAILNKRVRDIESERNDLSEFLHDVQLVMAGAQDTLCGSRWFNAASLKMAFERYDERTRGANPGRKSGGE